MWNNSCKLNEFTPASEEEIKKIIMESSNATADMDHMPTHVVKKYLDNLCKPITNIVNRLL